MENKFTERLYIDFQCTKDYRENKRFQKPYNFLRHNRRHIYSCQHSHACLQTSKSTREVAHDILRTFDGFQ